MNKELQIEIKIEEARWMNREANTIIVKLKNWEDKRCIIERKSKLKEKNVFIDNDLTWNEREIQRNLRKIAMTKREKGAK